MLAQAAVMNILTEIETEFRSVFGTQLTRSEFTVIYGHQWNGPNQNHVDIMRLLLEVLCGTTLRVPASP